MYKDNIYCLYLSLYILPFIIHFFMEDTNSKKAYDNFDCREIVLIGTVSERL